MLCTLITIFQFFHFTPDLINDIPRTPKHYPKRTRSVPRCCRFCQRLVILLTTGIAIALIAKYQLLSAVAHFLQTIYNKTILDINYILHLVITQFTRQQHTVPYIQYSPNRMNTYALQHNHSLTSDLSDTGREPLVLIDFRDSTLISRTTEPFESNSGLAQLALVSLTRNARLASAEDQPRQSSLNSALQVDTANPRKVRTAFDYHTLNSIHSCSYSSTEL